MHPATHFAILGRQPELGLIELESVLGSGVVERFNDHALLHTPPPHIDRLGGSIKTGKIIARFCGVTAETLIDNLDTTLLGRPSGKLTFGLSWYGRGATSRQLSAIGLELKKRLKVDGAVRFVAPKPGEITLSAAQYKFNHLETDGFELVIMKERDELIVGVISHVQDIDAYAARDHGRPARSAKVGMLPPKLAQILINTTHGAMVHDPFCGTGVVLQEALLLGREASGSDLEASMVEATTINLAWLAETMENPSLQAVAVTCADARSVVLPDQVRSIVSEGYLGPNLTSTPSEKNLIAIQQQLIPLYAQSLKNLAAQLPSGSEVSICAPAWRVGKQWTPLQVVDEAARLGYTTKVFETVPSTATKPLIYARDDQTVGRALILLTKV